MISLEIEGHLLNWFHVRLDSHPDVYKQPREEAEMTMQELSTLAQHTSVSSILYHWYEFVLLRPTPFTPSLLSIFNAHIIIYLGKILLGPAYLRCQTFQLTRTAMF